MTVAAERHVSDDERDENRRVAESIIAVTALMLGALRWNCADARGLNDRSGMAEVQGLCRGTLRTALLQAFHPRAARR